MAIEKVKRAWFLVERGQLDTLIQGLARSRTVHIVDLKEEAPEGEAARALLPADRAPTGGEAEDKVSKLTRALDILDGFAPPKRSFAQNFVSLPAEMTRDEFDRCVVETNVEEIYEQTLSLQRAHAASQKKAEELTARIARLEPWTEADIPPRLERCRADLGTLPAKAVPKIESAARESEAVALSPVLTSAGTALVSVVWLKEAEGEAADLLHEYAFESLGLEEGIGKVGQVVQRRQTALVTVEAKLEILRQRAAKLARRRRAVLATLAHWQAEVERYNASAKILATKRIATLSGYVRVREMPKLEELLDREFPAVSLIAEDPKPGEDVPVSLGGSKIFAPAQFLTSMFGLPNYFEFDPSPFIFLTFLIFFGFCFGDVVYGLALVLLGRWLARKSADYPSLARFFGLLTWCGIASIIVGLITGSWAADLLSGGYLGEGAKGFVTKLMIVDPLKKTVMVLGVVLSIGMLNQFYGMTLLMYREWRKRNYFAAVCDGGLWLIFLPGLILLLASGMGALPPVWTRVALGMVIASGVGLVLTQGRHEETFIGKAITGVVSLYGILGTYGTTSFIGDTLSYSRLLALGLTTVIVGTSFNIIAVVVPDVAAQFVLAMSQLFPFAGGLFKLIANFLQLPVVVLLISVVVMVFGHVFNFVVSILGGFVHSARLIFVEFFTKFYEGGARPFAPLGAPRTVRVIEKD